MKRLLIYPFLLLSAVGCNRRDDVAEAPCSTINSVIDRLDGTSPFEQYTNSFFYDPTFKLISFSSQGTNPYQVTYQNFIDGYGRVRSGTAQGIPVYEESRTFLDVDHKMVHVSRFYEHDSANSEEIYFFYNTDGSIQSVRSESRSKLNSYKYTGNDSLVYSWVHGNIVKSERYVTNDSMNYTLSSHTLFEYDDNHSGFQVSMLFAKNEDLFLHPEVKWIYTSSYLKKSINYNGFGSVTDSTVYDSKFDSQDRVISVTRAFYLSSNPLSSLSSNRYFYRCK